MDISEVLSAQRSPWQRAYVERVIGTIRRDCLDPSIVAVLQVGGLHHRYERRAT